MKIGDFEGVTKVEYEQKALRCLRYIHCLPAIHRLFFISNYIQECLPITCPTILSQASITPSNMDLSNQKTLIILNKGMESPIPDCPWLKEEPVVWRPLPNINAPKTLELGLVMQEEAEDTGPHFLRQQEGGLYKQSWPQVSAWGALQGSHMLCSLQQWADGGGCSTSRSMIYLCNYASEHLLKEDINIMPQEGNELRAALTCIPGFSLTVLSSCTSVMAVC
ncbi:Serine/threonine-protein kinase PLK1 [Galemys pyrenaicus]|uniref:Serine/threonine-protein kinase PLK1 n=1 Tax=Galemys pyrenaicus TaxID=202257 RepID=A0A8J6DDP1_GALPY|nr:Serine/threonine-protein kinase PLK1 [Galemys pyrenaicus]